GGHEDGGDSGQTLPSGRRLARLSATHPEIAMAHTLENFAAECHKLLAAEPGPKGRQKVCDLLKDALKDPAFVAANIPEGTPERKIIYEDPKLGFCILAHAYDGKKTSAPHDHGPSVANYGQAKGV